MKNQPEFNGCFEVVAFKVIVLVVVRFRRTIKIFARLFLSIFVFLDGAVSKSRIVYVQPFRT